MAQAVFFTIGVALVFGVLVILGAAGMDGGALRVVIVAVIGVGYVFLTEDRFLAWWERRRAAQD